MEWRNTHYSLAICTVQTVVGRPWPWPALKRTLCLLLEIAVGVADKCLASNVA